MKRRPFLALAVLTPGAGCLDFVDENGEPITEPGDVEIVWSDLVRENPGTDEERVYVWGVVRNVGDRTLNYVEIRAIFFDEDGEVLNEVIQNVEEDVTSGEEWEFTIEFQEFGEQAARVADYELEPATGV